MSHPTIAPERSASPRSSRLRSLLATVDRFTLKTMNAPAHLGGTRTESADTTGAGTTGGDARR